MSPSDVEKVWNHLQFGEITQKVVDRIDNIACEVAYYDCNGDMIGYWAYGSFDPAYPYQG